MSKIYSFLTLFLLSAFIYKAHERLLNQAKLDGCKTILDVGCGTGNELMLLVKNRYRGELYGVDLSKSMLKIANRRKNGAHLTNVNLILADAENLPFKTDAFQLVTCAGVLRFLPYPGKMLKDTYRVLKNRSSIILREFAGAKTEVIEIQHFPLPFQRSFTVWRLRSDRLVARLLNDAGFSSVNVFRKGIIPHVPIAMGGPYRTNLYAVGQKSEA